MANIENELSQIKNSIYGNEIRTAIHDGIKKINDSKIDTDSIYNDLDKTEEGYTLDARQGKILDDDIKDLKITFNKNNISRVRIIDDIIYVNMNIDFEQGAFTSTNPDSPSETNIRSTGYIDGDGDLYLFNPGGRLAWVVVEFTENNSFVKYIKGSIPSISNNFYRDEIFKLPPPSSNGNKYRIRVSFDVVGGKSIIPDDNTIAIYSPLMNVEEIVARISNTEEDISALDNKFLNIFKEFSPTTNYSIGYIVFKDGLLYEFTSEHFGEWTGDDVINVNYSNKLYKSLQIRGTNVAEAGTLLSEIVYRQPGIYRWNTAHQPGDLPSGESGAGTLFNIGETNATSILTQLLIMNTSAKLYYRQLYAANKWTKWKTIFAMENILYCYRRDYDDITGLLTWERKSIGTISGITESSSRLIAKLPNAGNVEVKMNTPNSAFVVVLEDNSGDSSVYTYLTDPAWCTYFYRYTGNPAYNYYVMTRMQNNSDIGIEYGPLNVKVYIYDDVGDSFAINNPWYGKKVAIIGDSIVQGRFRKNATSGTNSTAAKPAAVLISEKCNTEPGNYGIGGATVYGSDWKSLQTNASKIAGYDIVLIFAGTNDFGGNVTIENFSAAYTEVVNTLKSNNTRVIAITPTARSTDNTNSLGLRLKDYSDAIKLVASSKSIDVIDINAMTFDNSVWVANLSDGLHPNEVGQKIIADMILDSIS